MEVKPGYKQTDAGVIPQDWAVRSLGALTTMVASGRSSAGAATGDYPVHGSTGIIGSTANPEYEGDAILVARVGANAGRLNFVSGKYGVTDNTIMLRLLGNYCLPFFWRQLETKRLNSLVFGSGQPLITGTQLKALPLAIPPLPEQRAIAAALSDVDALLTALDRHIAKKRDLKQAAMQQLLSGQIRLPGFSGEWDMKPLGSEIADLEAGVSVNSLEHDLESGSSHLAVLKTSAVANGRFVPSECKTIVARDLRRVKLSPRAESVIISRMNTIELVGECGYVPSDFPKLFVPDRLWMTRFKPNSRVSAKWLASVLNLPTSRRLIRNIATGTSGSMKNIAKGKFLALELAFPPPDEQAAIAAVLADIDAELAALEQRLAKTRDIKRGMMQELLTGKTRLVSKGASHA